MLMYRYFELEVYNLLYRLNNCFWIEQKLTFVTSILRNEYFSRDYHNIISKPLMLRTR